MSRVFNSFSLFLIIKYLPFDKLASNEITPQMTIGMSLGKRKVELYKNAGILSIKIMNEGGSSRASIFFI